MESCFESTLGSCLGSSGTRELMQVNRFYQEVLSRKPAIEGELAKLPGTMNVRRAKIKRCLLAFAGTHFQPILGPLLAPVSLFESSHSAKRERSCHVS